MEPMLFLLKVDSRGSSDQRAQAFGYKGEEGHNLSGDGFS